MMTIESKAVTLVKIFFSENKGRFIYTNQKGNVVNCEVFDDGIIVDCLGNAPHKDFLPWGVFWHAVNVMMENGGKAPRGSAMNSPLGGKNLPFNSVEGRIANVIYGKQEGEHAFQRISPIAHILKASGVCIDQTGDLELDPSKF